VTQITNPLSQQNSFVYNYVTGSLVSSTDANSQTTTYGYSDPLFRLTNITGPVMPGGGSASTTYSYNDSAPSVTTTTSAAPDPNIVKVSVRDGMGHVVHTQLTYDPQGTDYVDTVYNGMGLSYTVSNPYRSPADPTYGLTTYTYDALGRKLTQLQQDSTSSLTWLYNGNVTTFTDEVGNAWRRTSDAFGRLINVAEPTTATTIYTYNALNNLLSVTQNGVTGETPRSRGFNYDSLSRLTSSRNPETGMISYGYDANGNLTSKTDARGVTTNYLYDALNRTTAKTYSGQNAAALAIAAATASSCWQYDTATNGIGRLGAQWTQTGSCSIAPGSGALSQKTFALYDPLGRVTSEQQCVLTKCSTDYPGYSSYTYDLAGNMTNYGNGIGTTLFTNQYDAVSRLQTLTSSWNDATHPPDLFSAPSYTAAGGLVGGSYGQGLSLTRTYDSRLRTTSETDIRGATQATGGTTGSFVITITGSEQSK